MSEDGESLARPSIHATKITYIGGRPTTITLRKCRLSVQVSPTEVVEHAFDKDVVTIGAMDENDVVLTDETVSRNHCRIFVEGDQYLVADSGSTNGTLVNGVRIREAFLDDGAVVTCGQTQIRFRPVDEKHRIIPSEEERYGEIVGRSRSMREIYAILEKIAPTDATVVIEGETGTGKEVIARTIHQRSRRKDGPCIVFDCGAVPENLIESELFGHERGAFTGAHLQRQGVFELAHRGTVFLDELGELALELQPKLLRVLEQREVKRVGGSRTQKLDVRVIAATNRDLEEEVRAGRFREDLFYRLSVVRVILPPLRERKEDIPLLVQHFLESSGYNRDRDGRLMVHGIDPVALERLDEYDWPGNVRELSNVVERAVSFADGGVIHVDHLPDHIARDRNAVSGGGGSDIATNPSITLPEWRQDGTTFKNAKERWVATFEKDYIQGLLDKNDNNISHAAKEADIDRKYFRKLMKKYGIKSP